MLTRSQFSLRYIILYDNVLQTIYLNEMDCKILYDVKSQ